MLGNTGGAGPAQVAAGVFTNGLFLTFSRGDEIEAEAMAKRDRAQPFRCARCASAGREGKPGGCPAPAD